MSAATLVRERLDPTSVLIGGAIVLALFALMTSSYALKSVRFTASALSVDHSQMRSSGGPVAASKSGSGELLLTVLGVPDVDASVSAKAAAEAFDAPVR